jgi:hypothetical protein
MNLVRCRDCSEIVIESRLTAEALEGLGYRCPHCDTFGRVVLRENDEGGLAAIELVAEENPR